MGEGVVSIRIREEDKEVLSEFLSVVANEERSERALLLTEMVTAFLPRPTSIYWRLLYIPDVQKLFEWWKNVFDSTTCSLSHVNPLNFRG